MDFIELLTGDDDGHAVEGMRFPADRGVAVKYLEGDKTRVAYRTEFFELDFIEGGPPQPKPETLVAFYVPEWMLDGSEPRRVALDLVAERMDWT